MNSFVYIKVFKCELKGCCYHSYITNDFIFSISCSYSTCLCLSSRCVSNYFHQIRISYFIDNCIDKFCPPGTFCDERPGPCVKPPCRTILACLPIEANGTNFQVSKNKRIFNFRLRSNGMQGTTSLCRASAPLYWKIV